MTIILPTCPPRPPLWPDCGASSSHWSILRWSLLRTTHGTIMSQQGQCGWGRLVSLSILCVHIFVHTIKCYCSTQVGVESVVLPPGEKQLSVIKYNWDKTSHTPLLTGIYLYVIILENIKNISYDFEQFKEKVMVQIKEGLYNIYMGGGMYRATKILYRTEDSHKYMNDLILQETGLPQKQYILQSRKKKRQFLEVMKSEEGCTYMGTSLRGCLQV